MFETIWHEIHSLVYPCSPIKILLKEIEMLGASVDILDQLLELSVTGDTAKYLVLTLQRLCTFTIRPNKPKLSSSTQVVLRKRRELRRDFSEAFSIPCRLDPFHLHPLHLLVKPGGVHAT